MNEEMKRNWVRRRVKRGVKFAAFGVVAIAVFGFVVRGLWNWLMPPLFGLHALTFWQALGLLVLSWILFGGLRGGPGRYGRRRFRERWKGMSPSSARRSGQEYAGMGGTLERRSRSRRIDGDSGYALWRFILMGRAGRLLSGLGVVRKREFTAFLDCLNKSYKKYLEDHGGAR